jgi:hypothetical protein
MHLWPHIPEILLCSLAYILAFFLPGYFFSKWLRSSAPVLSAFVLSLLLLYQGFLWLEIMGIPLRFSTMLGWELVCAFVAFFAWRAYPPTPTLPGSTLLTAGPSTRGGSVGAIPWFLISLGILTGAILLLRAWLVPLTGPDLGNRWDQLAREVLLLHHYHFYPPQSAEDFHHYGFPESLPPMLTAVHWWLYASLGRAVPRATAPFIMLQYAVLAGFVHRLTKAISSPLAAAIAVILLAAAPLTFFSLVLGQEAGLVAVGATAMLYFIWLEPDDWRGAILAGCAASFAPLVREYALAYLFLGFCLSIWRRRNIRWLIIFCITSAALAAPWYIRTWLLTGNPIYSLSILGLFPVNPIIAAQYRIAGQTRSFWLISSWSWQSIGKLLLEFAPLQLIFGIPILIASIRQQTWLLVSLMLFFALWLISLGLSDSLMIWTRTLLPALAVLSILSAIATVRLFRFSATARMTIICLLLASWSYTAAFGLIYPRALSVTPPSDWLASAFATDFPHWDKNVVQADFAGHLPAGCRVLSTDLFAWSYHLRTPNEVVPLWSPEVGFIFDSSLPLSEVYDRLATLHIGAIWWSPDDLHRFSFNRLYAQGPPDWTRLAQAGSSFLDKFPQPK